MEYIKRWILRREFVIQYAARCVSGFLEGERPKIFAAAQKDILETMRDDLDKQAEELAKKKLEALLSPIDETQIVKLDPRTGVVTIGDLRPEESQINNLRSEAEFFQESDLWKLLYESPKALAQKVMFVDGENIETLRKGRSMLYTLETQKRIIDIFKSFKRK
jgi:hypothetical protein